MSAVRAQVGRLAAITRRDLVSESTYHFRHVIRLVQFALTAGITFHVSKLIVVDPPELEQYVGAYFDFAMVGLAVMSIAGLGVSAFNQNIMAEQSLGTMEVLLATPTPLPVLLAGSFVFPLMLAALDLFLYLVVGVGLLGVGLSVDGVLLSVPVLVLTLASFAAFGIIGAAVVVLAKRGDPLTAPLLQLTAVLSGALFPVTLFPPTIEVVARVFPAYYGINGLRDALLGTGGWRAVAPDVAVLAGFTVVLLPLSLLIFSRAVAVARRAGTLGNY